jgi:alpha-ribazole phosphatase
MGLEIKTGGRYLSKLLLVRHGETEWNQTGRYQGHSDISLSDTGHRQADALKKRLSNESIEAVYSSDLKRAVQTAQIIMSAHNTELTTCEELRELNFGKFEGLTFEEIKKDRIQHNWWTANHLDEKIPNGESIRDLTNRVSQLVGRLDRQANEEIILIIGHGGSLRALICLLLGFSSEYWWRIRLDSASLTIVETYPEGAVLSLLNDLCHLGNSNNRRL